MASSVISAAALFLVVALAAAHLAASHPAPRGSRPWGSSSRRTYLSRPWGGKRDPEVLNPLVLDKREKKDYSARFRARQQQSYSPMKAYFYRNLRSDMEQVEGDPALAAYTTDELVSLLRLLDAWQADRDLPLTPAEQEVLWELLRAYGKGAETAAALEAQDY